MLETPKLAPLDVKEQRLLCELITLCLGLSTTTPQTKLIFAVCIHNLILLVNTHSS